MIHRLFSVICLLFTGLLPARSQDTGHPVPPETMSGILALQVGLPFKDMQEAIRNNMGNAGFGLGLVVLSNPSTWGRNKRNGPVRIGGEIGYTYYGRFISDVNINGYYGSYKTSYGILQLNAVLRLCAPEPGPVRPFFEVLAGGNFYLSDTKDNLTAIESALGIQGFNIDSYASVGFNKGVAAGCTFRKKSNSDAGFSIRLSYNVGSDIKYVVRNSLVFNPGSGHLEYQIGRARVNYLMIQVGVGF